MHEPLHIFHILHAHRWDISINSVGTNKTKWLYAWASTYRPHPTCPQMRHIHKLYGNKKVYKTVKAHYHKWLYAWASTYLSHPTCPQMRHIHKLCGDKKQIFTRLSSHIIINDQHHTCPQIRHILCGDKKFTKLWRIYSWYYNIMNDHKRAMVYNYYRFHVHR